MVEDSVEALAWVEASVEASVEALAWVEASVEDSVEALAWVEASVEASVDGGPRLTPVTMGQPLPMRDMVTHNTAAPERPTTPHIAHGDGIRFFAPGHCAREVVYRDG